MPRWYASTVSYVLHNGFYAGLVQYDGQEVDGAVSGASLAGRLRSGAGEAAQVTLAGGRKLRMPDTGES